MKKTLSALSLLLLLTPNLAYAAIAATTTWEVRATHGSNVYGGGFVPAITAISSKTDLVVSAGSNVQVSSATYTFTSADVGRYINITAGTGFATGYYQVLSVTTGVAILDRSPAPVSTTGGSFTAYYGIDYTQQNSKNTTGNNISTTDAVTAGTTTVVSATGAFTADIVGNVIYLAGGSGSIVGGWYEVTAYTNATTITVDRSTGLTAGTGVTMNIGGALQTLAQLSTNMVGGNQAFVKAEATYGISSGLTLSQNEIGYTSLRGDGGKATIQDTATASITLVAMSSGNLRNFIVDCNSQTGTTGVSVSGGAVLSDLVKNCATRGVFLTNPSGGVQMVINSEITGDLTGSTGGIVLDSATSATASIIGNYIHDGIANGIAGSGGGSAFISNNVISNRTGGSSSGISVNYPSLIVTNNTIYNTGSYGINTYNFGTDAIFNNIISTTGAAGINVSTATIATYRTDGNAFYSNTGAAATGINSPVPYPYVNSKDIAVTYQPFTSTVTPDYSLNSTVGGGAALKNTGVPYSVPTLVSVSHPDFGVFTHSTSGGSSPASAWTFGQ